MTDRYRLSLLKLGSRVAAYTRQVITSIGGGARKRGLSRFRTVPQWQERVLVETVFRVRESGNQMSLL
jgi:hypothetical protein